MQNHVIIPCIICHEACEVRKSIIKMEDLSPIRLKHKVTMLLKNNCFFCSLTRCESKVVLITRGETAVFAGYTGNNLNTLL